MFTLPNISKSTNKPLYISLYENLKESIISHELKPKEKMPSKRKLATLLGVSIKTVENAYDQLLLEGFIYSIEKKGFYVENLNQYKNLDKKAPTFDYTRFAETSYKVNLRANRNALEDFPQNLWCQLVRETLNDNREQLFDVVPFNGVYELRKAIASYLHENRGMNVSPDQIIVGAGTEYLYSRLIQILGRDSLYGLPEPSTKRLMELYNSNELRTCYIPADSKGLNMDKLNEYDCDVLHISPAHQYPLGHAILMPERIELLKWVNERPGRYIIEDDYDSEYVLFGKPIPSLYSIDIMSKIIYINTFSKSVAPAVRISYMVLPESLMKKYLDTMSFYSCTVAGLEQYTLAKFISKNHLDRYIRKSNRKNMQIRNEILHSLEPLTECGRAKIVSGEAGAHLLLKLENSGMEDNEIKTKLREKSIILSMLSEYYIHCSKEQKNTLVINYSGMDSSQINYFAKQLLELFNK